MVTTTTSKVWSAMFHLVPEGKSGMLDDMAGGYLTILFRCSCLKDFLGVAIDHLKDEGVSIVDIEDIAFTTSPSDAKLRGKDFFDAWTMAANNNEPYELPLHRYLDDA